MKILVVSHGIINNNSGLGRVHLELIEEYRKHGHQVDKVDYLDLYPRDQNMLQKIYQTSFTERILIYLKKNANKYDVIDANFENIPFNKNTFNYKGLLFVRSHGIRPLYIKAGESDAYKRNINEESSKLKPKTLKNKIGNYLRSKYKDFTIGDFYNSLKYADLVHCLNTKEYQYFLDYGVAENKLLFIPNGLPKSVLDNLSSNCENRGKNANKISVIASWGFIKGIKDWRVISRNLLKSFTDIKFKFIGTCMPIEFVKQDLDLAVHDSVIIIPSFQSTELPALLSDIKIGIFPSYMEGFGFAVLEQLAAGIPVVAYNVPGVSDMLNKVDNNLLVEPGNKEGLIENALNLFKLNNSDFEKLSKKCIQVAQEYILENLAKEYLSAFEKSLSDF